MTSKIINMAERIRDEKDRLLESMFESEPIADDGFSVAVVRKVRRRIWVRRLALPVATLIGLLISYKPMVALVTTVANLAKLVPADAVSIPGLSVPQLPILVLGALLFASCMVGLRVIED